LTGWVRSETVVRMKTFALWTVLLALLVLSLAGLAVGWTHGGLPRISMHGWIALGLGTVLSLVVGVGLMALVFYSARRGFDDGAGPA
jgi:hypothetical protein